MRNDLTPEAIREPAYIAPVESRGENRLKVLDGWRALSILMVLAAHLFPLGPKIFNFNAPVAAGGMAIFFTLSGFLITRFLLDRPEPFPFLIRRFLRILPLAWLAMLALYFSRSSNSLDVLAANLGFYANLPPAKFFPGGEHLWSLCVEIHFYVGVALLVALLGRRGLLLLPLISIAVTAGRIFAGETISIVTWHRLDEILAGAIIALVYSKSFGELPAKLLARCNFYLCAIVAAACTYAFYEPLGYARPYAIALMIGATLWQAPRWVKLILESRIAAYIATISYALYVFHGMLSHTWLGAGETLEKYAKRPLLLGLTWAAAHVSTFYYEKRFIDLGRRFTKRGAQRSAT